MESWKDVRPNVDQESDENGATMVIADKPGGNKLKREAYDRLYNLVQFCNATNY